MSAAPSLVCPRCGGHPERLERGCVSCDDSGLARVERETTVARPRVPERAIEHAERALHRLFVSPFGGVQRADANDLARKIARGLSVVDDRAIERVRAASEWGPQRVLTEAQAREVVSVYVAALREQARSFASAHGGAKDRAREEAERCRVHALRIEACLPVWAQAAE